MGLGSGQVSQPVGSSPAGRETRRHSSRGRRTIPFKIITKNVIPERSILNPFVPDVTSMLEWFILAGMNSGYREGPFPIDARDRDMRLLPKRLGISVLIVGALTAAAAGRARADVTLVPGRAALDGNAILDWGQLGAEHTPIANPSSVTATPGGLSAQVSQEAGMGLRADQDSFWDGN